MTCFLPRRLGRALENQIRQRGFSEDRAQRRKILLRAGTDFPQWVSAKLAPRWSSCTRGGDPGGNGSGGPGPASPPAAGPPRPGPRLLLHPRGFNRGPNGRDELQWGRVGRPLLAGLARSHPDLTGSSIPGNPGFFYGLHFLSLLSPWCWAGSRGRSAACEPTRSAGSGVARCC